MQKGTNEGELEHKLLILCVRGYLFYYSVCKGLFILFYA